MGAARNCSARHFQLKKINFSGAELRIMRVGVAIFLFFLINKEVMHTDSSLNLIFNKLKVNWSHSGL